MIVLPFRRSTSFARSKSSGAPPIMIVSVALSAPTVAPVTGASTKCTPRVPSRTAVLRLTFGSPLVASIHNVSFVSDERYVVDRCDERRPESESQNGGTARNARRAFRRRAGDRRDGRGGERDAHDHDRRRA